MENHQSQNAFLDSSNFLGRPAELGYSSFTSLGSLIYIIMQVILSVPVPSDIVISPLAIPWSINSSIMKDVSPGGFVLFYGADFCLVTASELFPYALLVFIVYVFFSGFGPFSRLVRTNLAAYSFVKQSQMPSQATMMKSCSGLIATFLTSGKDDT